MHLCDDDRLRFKAIPPERANLFGPGRQAKRTKCLFLALTAEPNTVREYKRLHLKAGLGNVNGYIRELIKKDIIELIRAA